MASRPVTIDPDASWLITVNCMLSAGVRALPVVDDAGSLLGIVTDGDLLSRAAFQTHHHLGLAALADLVRGDARWPHKASGSTAEDFMTTTLCVAAPDDDIADAARRMLERGVQHLPVLEAGRLIGMVSRRDLLVALAPPRL